MFKQSKFETFMWNVFPYIFWTMWIGMFMVMVVTAGMMVFNPRFVGEWNAELLAPIIEKIKE